MLMRLVMMKVRSDETYEEFNGKLALYLEEVIFIMVNCEFDIRAINKIRFSISSTFYSCINSYEKD